MKRLIYIIGLLALSGVLSAVSCSKPLDLGDEIVLLVGGEGLDVSATTKATAVTELPASLWWCGTTGTSGSSDVQKYSPASKAVSSTGKIATGKYQTATATKYNWYVSNMQMTVASGGPTLTVADNSVDVIAGCKKASTSTAPAVTLNHIFARTGTLTFNTQSGYTVSDVSWKISRSTSGTSGTYNISSGAWTAGSTAMAETALTSSSDLYLVPGSYTVRITYTLSREHYSETFTRSGSVTLVAGKINNITATATGGSAVNINVSTTLSGWTAGAGREVVM